MEIDRPEIVNVHTTPQELDPWYLADDPDDNKVSVEYQIYPGWENMFLTDFYGDADVDGNRTIS